MRLISVNLLLLFLAATPAFAQERWPGRDRLEAERCTPFTGDAAQWLRRADSATGLVRLGDRILALSGEEGTIDFIEADRVYPPFLNVTRQYNWWFDGTTGAERFGPVATVPGPRMHDVVRTGQATFAAHDTALQATPQLHPFYAEGRPLNPLAVLRDWEAAPGVAISFRCVFRDYPRVVLTQANASDRLYLDEKTGVPVKFERTEPNLLWGQTLAEYVYATWWQIGPVILPLASKRYMDGVEERWRVVAQPPTPAAIAAVTTSRDSAPLLRLPPPLPDHRPVPKSTPATIAVDTIRVSPNTVLLHAAFYTHAVTLARDTIFLLDATTSETRSRTDSALIAGLFPGRHPMVVVVTDLAWPHIAGVRFWAARGATIVTHSLSRDFLEAVLAHRWTLAPDALEKARGKIVPNIRTTSGPLDLAGGAIRVRPIDGVSSEGALMVFVTGDGFLWASDYIQMVTSPSLYASEVFAAVRRAGFAPARVAAEHLPLTPWTAVEAIVPH